MIQPATAPKNPGVNIFIFSVVLLDVMGFSILMAVSAYVVRQYNPTALAVTMLTVIYAAAQFLAAPLLGKLSDCYGRRPILLICLLGSAIGYFIFGIGGALWVLFLSRLIDGITGGNFSVANAYIADVTAAEERTKSFALIGAAFGAGFVLGPALGGLLSRINLVAPAYGAGLLSLLNFLVGWFILPESLPAEKRRTTGNRPSFRIKDINPLSSIAEFLRRPNLRLLLLSYVLFQFAFTGNNAIFQVFAINKFNISPLALAILLTVSGIGNIVIQGFLVGHLARRIGERLLTSIGFIAQSVTLICIYLSPSFWMLYPIILLSTGFNGLIWPTLTSMISNSVPQNEQGNLSGTTMALASLMSIFGPLATGALYDHLSHLAPFVLGTGIFFLAWLLLRVKKTGRQEKPADQ